MREKKIGLLEAVSIGIGGMIGGGIFAVLGLTVLLAKGAAPIAFFFAGLIALLTAYSYAKLSVRFPSQGGTIEFIVRAFGNGTVPAWLNTLLLASYIIMLALYSYAFGSYGAALIKGVEDPFLKKVLTVFVILFFTFLNLLGAYVVGKAEDLMVIFKVIVLLLFSLLGLFTANFSRLDPHAYPHFLHILTGGFIIFLAYEGFELIANTAQDVERPEKTLPRAFFISVLVVIFIYCLVALVAVANLEPQEVLEARDYVLAKAAEPFLGEAGFVIISVAALVSTASAINATLYGTARISYLVAKYGELPQIFARRIWKGAYEGLIILALLTLVAALSFDLENISVAGSLGFLLVFGVVNLANFKLASFTRAKKFFALLGAISCFAAALVLVLHNLKVAPKSLYSAAIVLSSTFLFELIYRLVTKRKLSEFIDWRLRDREEFLDNFEKYTADLARVFRKRVKEAEIYLLDELARGERDLAHTLHLAVVTPQKLSEDEQKELESSARKELSLKPHHPLRVTFLSREEKERLAKRSPRKVA